MKTTPRKSTRSPREVSRFACPSVYMPTFTRPPLPACPSALACSLTALQPHTVAALQRPSREAFP